MKAVVYFLSSAAVLAVLAIPGCGKQRPGYHIVMINRTHRDLYGMAVYFDGKMAAEKGYTAKGGLASYGFVFLPIPDDAEVRWIDEAKNPSSKPQIAKNDYTPEAVDRLKRWIDQGEHHSLRVKLTGTVPEDPAHMNIYFIIEEDGTVTVKCVRSDDRAANMEARKGIEKLREKAK